jgi:heptosyltransferase-2
MRRHLIVKLAAIGDVVMTLSAVRLFKEKRGGEIHWMCGRSVAPLLRQFPFIDRLIEVDEKALLSKSPLASLGEIARVWKALAGQRYDTCAVLYYDWRYRLLVLPVRKKKFIMLSRTSRARRLLPGRYHGDEYARILLEEDGLRPERVRCVKPAGGPAPPPLAKGAAKRIALIPGGSRNALRDSPQRRWPLSLYLELSSALVAKGYEVVLAGGADDGWASEAFSGLPVPNFIGRLNLAESVALFDTCDLIISHDTGAFHLATLSSAAILALFGPTNPAEFAPDRPALRVLWGGESLACRPCYDGREFPPCPDNRCMKEISLRTVLTAVDETLAGSSLSCDRRWPGRNPDPGSPGA